MTIGYRKRATAFAFGAALTLLLAAAATPVRAEKVRIVRDDWGVPHIFGATDEAATYGAGYAQAEDRLEELLKNYMRAAGRMAEVSGQTDYMQDYIVHVIRNPEISQANYNNISPKGRRLLEAYLAGVKTFMKEHPEQVPAWAPDPQPWHVVALSRLVIMNWPLGDAMDELKAGGVMVSPFPYRGSNEWIIAGKRTEAGVPIALIDPHLSWYNVFRFYEERLYGDTIKFSGMSIVGVPLATLGHSDYLSIGMTTGSGDTADIFVEKVNPENRLQYEVDGKWVDMKVYTAKIGVKNDAGEVKFKDVPVTWTRHGPVISSKPGLVYAIGNPYAESVGLMDQVYDMITAKSLAEAKKAMGKLELMGQNVMIATVDGDTYYQRTGKVPIRPAQVDPSLPIPGHLTANDWLGIHPTEDLVQVENPEQGYMVCNNASPYWMMKNSPMRAAKYRPYIYGTDEHLRHQRHLMDLELLSSNDKVTVDQAKEIAMATQVYGATNWQSRLALALTRAKFVDASDPDAAKLRDLILSWDRRSRPDSVGATAYLYFKKAIWGSLTEPEHDDENVGAPPPERLGDDAVVAALKSAAASLKAERGGLEIPYGQLHRVGRKGGDKTYPVGGGNPGFGMGTPRAVNYGSEENGIRVGGGGQTSTQVVLLTKPPQSWSYIPLGESDHKESKHWDDQAEKLFGPGILKSTYFMNDAELGKHTESVKELDYKPAGNPS